MALISRAHYPDRTEAITSEIAWLKESIYGDQNVKLEFQVRDAFLRYSKRPGKKVVKEV